MKNQYRVTKKLYMSWAVENMFRGISLGMVIMWGALGVIFAVCSVFALRGELTTAWLYPVLSAYCLFRAFVRPLLATSMQYGRIAKLYGEADWLRTIEFTEDGILLSESTTNVTYSYGDIQGLSEKDGNVRVKLGRKGTIRLYKDSFTDCTWEECVEFIDTMRHTA